MKRFKSFSLFLVLLCFGCASTSNLTVRSDFDENAKFNDYQTFVICIDDLFVEYTNYPKYDNNHVRQLIGNEIENQMKSLGYKTNVLKPELQAGFQILIVESEATFTNCDLQEDYDYWETSNLDALIYTDETLVLYVSDLQQNQIIWQASMNCDLNKPKKALKGYVQDLVQMLFNEYPKTN